MSVSQAGYPRPFGSYLLLSSFGRGGMGEVFLAKRTAFEGIDRLCVVKTLRGELVNDQEYVRRFLDEARVLVQLHHANISQVFDAGTVDADYFMAMEYVSGTNIRELTGKLTSAGSALDPGVALYVISETLDALAYAHRLVNPMTGEQLSIIHRDVSPHNVMLSFEGEAKLIDFGLAESVLKEEQTESAVVLGKVAYMSPEQARGETVDASCDQFAVGVIAYELMAHERFYGAMKTHEIWQIVGHGGFLPRRWANIDPELQAIIARAWDPDPAARYPTCDAMREAIDDFRALRYPRIGKKQARSVMQGLYHQRILDERQLLQNFAETSSPGSLAPGRAITGSTSAVAVHGIASASELPQPDLVAEATRSSTQQTEEAVDVSHSSSLSRQERAFIEDAGPSTESDNTMLVHRTDTGAAPVAEAQPSSSRGPVLLMGAIAIAAMIALIVQLLPEAPPPGDGVVVNTPSDPAPVDPAPVDPAPVDPVPDQAATRDAGRVALGDPDPEPDKASPESPRARTSKGRRQRPKTTGRNRGRRSPPPPKKDPAADPPADPTPAPPPDPGSSDPGSADPVVKVVKQPPKAKEKPPKLSLSELVKRIDDCKTGHKCRAAMMRLPGVKSGNPPAGGRALLERCAYQCDGWKRVKGGWTR